MEAIAKYVVFTEDRMAAVRNHLEAWNSLDREDWQNWKKYRKAVYGLNEALGTAQKEKMKAVWKEESKLREEIGWTKLTVKQYEEAESQWWKLKE